MQFGKQDHGIGNPEPNISNVVWTLKITTITKTDFIGIKENQSIFLMIFI